MSEFYPLETQAPAPLYLMDWGFHASEATAIYMDSEMELGEGLC